MADISKITLPNGSVYNIKDQTTRALTPVSASVSNSGVVAFSNSSGSVLFQFQLPVYDISLNRDGEKLVLSPNQNPILTLSSTSWYLDNDDVLVLDENQEGVING